MIRSSFLSTFALPLAMGSSCLAASSSSSSSINSEESTRPLLQTMVDQIPDGGITSGQMAMNWIESLSLKDWKKLDPKKSKDKELITMIAVECARSGYNPLDDIEEKISSASCCHCCSGAKTPAAVTLFRREYDAALFKINKEYKQQLETVDQRFADMQKKLEELDGTVNTQNAEIEKLSQTLTEGKDTEGQVLGLNVQELKDNFDKEIAEQKQYLEDVRKQVEEVKVSAQAAEDLDKIHSQMTTFQRDLEDQKQALQEYGQEVTKLGILTSNIGYFKALTVGTYMFTKEIEKTGQVKVEIEWTEQELKDKDKGALNCITMRNYSKIKDKEKRELKEAGILEEKEETTTK